MIVRRLSRFPTRQLYALTPMRRFVYGRNSYSTQIDVSTPSTQEHVSAAMVQPRSDADGVKFGSRIDYKALGSKVSGVYEPEELLRNPPPPSAVTLEMLLSSQTHLGHATQLWNPHNSGYIYGTRDGVHIIDLEVIAACLRRAAKVVQEVGERGGMVLFVGTRKGQARVVVNAAKFAGGYHVFERWIPGTLTNAQRVLSGCELQIVDAFDRPIPDMQKHLENWPPLKPDLVVCLNPLENVPLLHECGLLTIPTIGIIDTDADPTRVTYPIPANDDSLRSVAFIAGVLGRAGQAGQKNRLELAQGETTYDRVTMEEITKFDNL